MDNNITAVRRAFLDFFNSKGHHIVTSSSLLPNHDSTLLFTNAGMNQFKDIFLGIEKYSHSRVVSIQKCLRVGGKHNDLDIIGYSKYHHTFFEMLGNFSFGDYFKYDAIRFSWELLTSKNWFNLSKDKIWITVYDSDQESYSIWTKEIGIPTERVIRIGNNQDNKYISDNFWQMSAVGPCGPCSEIFYDRGEHLYGYPPGTYKDYGDRYIEIWNLVFIQFNKQLDGALLPLPKMSVDTGMGLERITAILQSVDSNYDIDLFKQLISNISNILDITNFNNFSLRIIADHIRSCVFIINDGVLPSNEGRGYILRRLIRRAVRHGKILGIRQVFFYKLVKPLIDSMEYIFINTKYQQSMIEQILFNEEQQFIYILDRGLILLNNHLSNLSGTTLDGKTAFYLHSTYGFPLDVTVDICREKGITVDELEFKDYMLSQQRQARQLSNFNFTKNNFFVGHCSEFVGYEYTNITCKVIALFCDGNAVSIVNVMQKEILIVLDKTPFYAESGGQVGDKGELKSVLGTGVFKVCNTKKYGRVILHVGFIVSGKLITGDEVVACIDTAYRLHVSLNHSATHLLNSALRYLCKNNIEQKGSLVDAKRLRFDFSCNIDINLETIFCLEQIINQKICDNLLITSNIVPLKVALDKGAIFLLNKKYDSSVRMLTIKDCSIELCVGTHAKYTGDIGSFYITSISNVASGISRIEAVTGLHAISFAHGQRLLLHNISKLLKNNSANLLQKVNKIFFNSKNLERKIKSLENKLALQESKLLINNVHYVNNTKVLISKLKNLQVSIIKTMIDYLKQNLHSVIIIFVVSFDNNSLVNLTVSVTKDLIHRIDAIHIMNYLSANLDGKGGGKPELAQGIGRNLALLQPVLSSIDVMLYKYLK